MSKKIPDPIGTIVAIRLSSNGFQLVITGDTELLMDRGVAPEAISFKKGKVVTYHIRYNRNDLYLVQGDTHSIWLQHQTGENIDIFKKIAKTMKSGRQVGLTVVGLDISKMLV